MSTKIHTGFRLKEGTDLISFTVKARARLDEVRDQLDNKVLAEGAVQLLDNARINRTPVPLAPMVSANLIIREERRREDPGTIFSDPHYCTINFSQEPSTGRTYGILYASFSEAYKSALHTLPEVEPFAYWNNSDRPKELTQSEWDQRKSLWNNVLDAGFTGLSLELRTSADSRTFFLSNDENAATVATYVLSRMERARRLASLRITDGFMEHLRTDPDEPALFEFIRISHLVDMLLPQELINVYAEYLPEITQDTLIRQSDAQQGLRDENEHSDFTDITDILISKFKHKYEEEILDPSNDPL